jgi:hypothetical protein
MLVIIFISLLAKLQIISIAFVMETQEGSELVAEIVVCYFEEIVESN